MADISEYIEQIQNAVYGEEVRSSIINSLEAINSEVNKEAYTVTLAENGWEEDSNGYLVQIVENEAVTDHSTILVAMQTTEAGLNLEAAGNYSNIYHASVHNGYVKFYILEPASADVPINYVLISSDSGKVFITGSGITGSGGQLVLRGINVINMPNKTVYRKGESLVMTGLLVKARYNNGSVADVTAQCVLSADTAQTTAGTQTITLTYTEDEVTATTTFDITVYELASIAIITQPTTRTYKRGVPIDTTGMVVRATYTDGQTAIVTSECTLSTDTTQSTAGTQTIVVSYTEDNVTKTATFNITVYALASIALTAQPAKKVYYEGDSITTAGMTVTATYTDGHTANVTSSCTASPSTAPSGVMSSSVILTYTEDGISKTASYSITVYEFDATVTVNTKAGALVTATGATSGTVFSGTADENGTFTFVPHYSDTYNVNVSLGGFTGEENIIVSSATSSYGVVVTLNPSYKALLFTNKGVYKTDNSNNFVRLTTWYNYYSSRYGTTYFGDGVIIDLVNSSTGNYSNYYYSDDGGVNWTLVKLVAQDRDSCHKVRKLNDKYVFLCSHYNSSSSNYSYYYIRADLGKGHSDGVSKVSTSEKWIDYASDGTKYRALTENKVGKDSWVTLSSIGDGLTQPIGLIYGNGVWVIAAYNGFAYSEDGDSWTKVNLPESYITTAGQSVLFEFKNNVFYTSDNYGTIMKSLDGINWTVVNNSNINPTGSSFFAIGSDDIFATYLNGEVYSRVFDFENDEFTSPLETDIDDLTNINIYQMLMMEV